MPGGEQNTFGLPDGEEIRAEMAAIFREQRRAILGWMDENGYKAFGLPTSWPSWESLKLGAAEIAGRVKQPIADIWATFLDVSDPVVATKIDAQANALATNVNETTRGILDALLDKVTGLFNAGKATLAESIANLRRGVKEELQPMEAWRARRIAVTEASRAYHDAQVARAHKSGVVTGWKWLLADNPCPICVAIQEACPYARLDQPFAIVGTGFYSIIESPPVHPNCLLPETPIVAPVGIAGIVAQYNGPVVRLVFADGSDVTVTPNHMFLTVEGFATAASLVEGDDVICCGDGHGMAVRDPDDYWKPSTVKQVVDALSVSVGVTSRRVPVAPEYLHGDAALCDGEIDVVTADGFLSDEPYFLPDQRPHESREGSFERAYLGRSGLPPDGDLAAVLFALRDATDGGVGSIRERKAALRSKSLHPQLHGLGHGTAADAECDESAADCRARDAHRLRDCLLRFPGLVTTTKLVKVDRDTMHYVGPVYDVQTLTSLYLVGNGIATSNCMCSLEEVVLSDEQPEWGETVIDPQPAKLVTA